MRRAGEVVRTTNGVLVVRSDDDSHPDIGDRVVDEALDPVGTVVDVIGPVTRPYLVVSPDSDRPLVEFLNDRLYVP